MTQEQKARKFEDFLDKMRGLLDEANRQGHIIVRVEDLEHTFPELKESEEERIRKELIFYLGDMPEDTELRNGVTNRDVLVWLEKQGEKTSWKPSKEEMDVLYGLAYITNQYNEHKEEVITRLYQDLKREFFNGSSYENMFPTYTSTEDDVRRRSTIQVLEYARSLDTYNQYGKADIDKNIVWLEKQGEQKPAWSEEDEKTFSRICGIIHHAAFQNCDTDDVGNELGEYAKIINWLKSLKQRIGGLI